MCKVILFQWIMGVGVGIDFYKMLIFMFLSVHFNVPET